MPDPRRPIDANANRAREAMRVMEDAARFTLDDAPLAGALKQLRHDFDALVRALPGGPIARWRDTPGDVGTAITAEAERRRRTPADVAAAAAKRLTEALRCCEEFGKIIDPDFARRVERIRYRAYEIESRLVTRCALPDPARWRVCVLITEALCTHHGWRDLARAAVDGGADCIQLREKHLTDAQLLDRAAQLVDLAPALVVNDRPDIAAIAGAHGVHLGADDLPVAAVRKNFARTMLIGATTHNLRQAKAAIDAGADYCGVGAMFPSSTKPRRPGGIAFLRRYLRDFPHTPHLAIGGITPDNIDQLAGAGCRAVAVSACVCGARRPDAIVRKLAAAMK
jgi:thiamine-phosphate pyrophosphorylase